MLRLLGGSCGLMACIMFTLSAVGVEYRSDSIDWVQFTAAFLMGFSFMGFYGGRGA